MPVLYESFQSTLKTKSGKKLFYPRTVRIGTVNTSLIAKEIAGYSSLSAGDVKNCIDNLVTVMTQHLQASESVTLDGLGSFRMVIKSSGKGVEKEKDVSGAQATLHVCFVPSCTRNPDRSVATRSLVTGVECVRYDRAGSAGTGGGEVSDPGDGGGEAPDPSV